MTLGVAIYIARISRREDQARERREFGSRMAEQERRLSQAAAAEREQRIGRVVGDYVRLATVHPIQDTGIHALIVAGIKELRANAEYQDALQRITTRVGSHPLGADAHRLDPAHLQAFFQEVTTDGPNTLGYAKALAKFGVTS